MSWPGSAKLIGAWHKRFGIRPAEHWDICRASPEPCRLTRIYLTMDFLMKANST